MLIVRVIEGDVTTEPSDALITAINSGGAWFGGVDRAIQRVAGAMFHRQADEQQPLTDGDVIYAPARGEYQGRFGSVIFVVDDLQRPLRDILTLGLHEAERRQLAKVTLPSLRTGVMAGVYERTIEEALDETAAAITKFHHEQPAYVLEITVVVYGDRESTQYLTAKLCTG